MINKYFRKIIKRNMPLCIKPLLYKIFLGYDYLPDPGTVNFGDLRRLKPLDPVFGYNRGSPIDRYYIDNFIKTHAADIQGRVLEALDDNYTKRFGGSRVTSNEILHLDNSNPKATLVADLAKADHIPSNSFDTIILTEVLYYIYDFRAAIKTIERILKPGGTLLVTVPGILKNCREDAELCGENYWRFTKLAALRAFEEVFPKQNIQVNTHGNVLVATAFLWGLAQEELTKQELDYNDPDYELTTTVRATKP